MAEKHLKIWYDAEGDCSSGLAKTPGEWISSSTTSGGNVTWQLNIG